MKNILIASLIIGVCIIVAGYFSSDIIQNVGSAGAEHSNLENFYGGLVQGGGRVQYVASSALAISARDICYNDIISITPILAQASTTFPTATSVINMCLPHVGDFKDVFITNPALLSTNTIVFATSTGSNLMFEDVTGSNLQLNNLSIAQLRFVRNTSTQIGILFTEFDR